MASYKLIQDIEADDKLLGPLSFRQFIYALAAVFMLYISYMLYIHHGEFLLIATVPIALFAGFLAFPFGKDQPTEVWAVAKLRFFIKPRRRIWAQSGIKQLVTITVPKKVEVRRTDGLSQVEVKSRLQALANTIDTRGWAVKNVDSVYENPLNDVSDSDRLVTATAMPQDVPDSYATPSDDLFDEKTNPIAQQVDHMLSENTSQHRKQLMNNLNNIRKQVSVTGYRGPAPDPSIVLPPDNEIEDALKAANTNAHHELNNMHALRQTAVRPLVAPKATLNPASTPATDPVIMNLSQRDDLNVNVISHEADRAKANKLGPDEEVLVSLH